MAGRHGEVLAARNTSAVTLGIRPQFVSVLENGADPEGRHVVDATVELYEPLGANGVLLADVGGVQLTAMTAPDSTFDFGERIKLGLRTDAVLYFDPGNGANLVR